LQRRNTPQFNQLAGSPKSKNIPGGALKWENFSPGAAARSGTRSEKVGTIAPDRATLAQFRIQQTRVAFIDSAD
jgi:hypothetical protein